MATLWNTAVSIKKRSLLPILTVLFLISYGLMTLLIVEQGSTIQNQRALIHELFSDSVQLSMMKGQAVRDKNLADAQHQAPAAHAQANQAPLHETPSNQVPLTQAPSNQSPSNQARSSQAPSSQAQNQSEQTPSSQAAPRHSAQNNAGKTHKPQMQMPSRPAADLVDERRALNTI